MQNPILHHMRRRSIGVIGGNLDEHLSKATRLFSSKHLQERLGCVLETIVFAFFELQVTESKLLGDGRVKVINVLGLET